MYSVHSANQQQLHRLLPIYCTRASSMLSKSLLYRTQPCDILEGHSSIPLTPTVTQSVCSPLWQSKTCNTALFNCEVNIYCPESTLCWTIANLGRSRLMQHWIVTSLHCFDTMIVSALDICNVTILSSHLSIFITALPPADVIYLVQCPRFCQW